ncbi:NAD-dependent epimerase/dehydratase family protein [Kribbella sp. NPDC004536]|uniref:NAD-dependent epimerase/dehydratase family protein n=1 Tax=Kribbella sp. NPDC004536 TaxID=3364106 RepID=UPI0036B3B3D2
MSGHVVVTGGRGTIGSAVCHQLHHAGTAVTSVDVVPVVTATPFEQVVGDVRDLDAMTTVLKAADAIVHCGGLASDRPGREYDTYDINVAGTCTLLLAAARAGVRRIVHLSSINALGCVGVGTPAYLPVDDDHPHTPISPYQLSKHLAEEACRQFAERHDATVVCLRPTYVIQQSAGAGPGAADLFAYVDLRDVVRAVKSALSADLTGFHTALLAADDLWGEHGSGPHTSLVSCANAQSLLGWTPRYRHTV